MQCVREVYIDWADNMARIALGVAPMRATREETVQEQVHFLYPALGWNFPRSHRRPTYLYEGWAPHWFNGVVPEYVISRCKEFTECAHGGMWRIGQRGDTSRSETDIFPAMDRAYKSISAPYSGVGVGKFSCASANIDGERRGVKRKIRPRMEVGPGDVPVAGDSTEEKKVAEELILPTLDVRRTKESEIPATSWANPEALN